MEKAQDIEATNLVKNTMTEKVGPGVFWSVLWLVLFVLGIFFLLRQSICSLLTSFILMDSTWECEETTPKQKDHSCQVPCVSLSLLYPTQGQCWKVQHWGNADPGSPVASLHHTSLLCPSISSQGGRQSLGWSHSHTPSHCYLQGIRTKPQRRHASQASHHQDFKNKREHMKVSWSLMVHAHNWRGKLMYWICIPSMHWVFTACMGCRLWNKPPWLEIKKKRRIAAFLFHGDCFSNHWERTLAQRQVTPVTAYTMGNLPVSVLRLSPLHCKGHHVTSVTQSSATHKQRGSSLTAQPGRTSCEHLGVGGNLPALHLCVWAL